MLEGQDARRKMTDTAYETIRVETRGRVGWITLDRPEALNALNAQVMRDVVAAATAFDADEQIGAIVLIGSERAFAAGADIKEMEGLRGRDVAVGDHFQAWQTFADIRTPVVAAVAGYALGGGCELAMMCDIVLAADTAKFGQPEITLGVIPGMGGTQRLVRAIGYFKAAELVLTGRVIDAHEAERIGLVSRLVPADTLLEEAGALAESVAAKPLPAVYAAKAALDAALEVPLREGLRLEKHLFASMFDTDDQKEGMAAFREKRPPRFTHR
jgi:enoyl-CoA hydratase